MPLPHDFDSLTPSRPYTRRDFVATGVGSGFAAAVLPVSAQTIVTDATGLIAGRIQVPVGDFSLPAYIAKPSDPGRWPVVLVISEIFGVHDHIADVVRRFARQGYMAIAPELFVRQGDAKAYTDIPTLLSEVIAKKPDAEALADLDACIDWCAATGGDTARLGVTGFCWGGRMSWLYAAHQPRVRAAVAWYGRLVGEATPNTPSHPVDRAGALLAPVLGLYGGQDGGIPLDTVDKMKIALAAGSAAAKRSEFVVYPDAPHAFHADYRPSYRKDAAEDGWKRCLAWFHSHGVK